MRLATLTVVSALIGGLAAAASPAADASDQFLASLMSRAAASGMNLDADGESLLRQAAQLMWQGGDGSADRDILAPLPDEVHVGDAWAYCFNPRWTQCSITVTVPGPVSSCWGPQLFSPADVPFAWYPGALAADFENSVLVLVTEGLFDLPNVHEGWSGSFLGSGCYVQDDPSDWRSPLWFAGDGLWFR